MPKRFVLGRDESQRVLKHLQGRLEESVPNADRFWIEALSSVVGSDLRSLSTTDVHNILLGIVASSQEIPWNFYDIVSELIKHIPGVVREPLIHDLNIQTGYEYEHLRPTLDGHWQIVWEINPNAPVIEYREIALDWYIPSNKKKANKKRALVVPSPILDHIASCVALLRNKLVLPAASVLSVILEAALWDELQTKKLLQKRQEVTYASVEWHLEKYGDQFRLKVEGADKKVIESEIPSDLLSINSTRDIIFKLRRMHIENADKTVDLRLSVDKRLVNFLASNQIAEVKDMEPNRGLSTAIERARKEKLECLNRVPIAYDKTLITLRNSLIHLPSNGKLSHPIPIPGDGLIRTTEELRDMEEFIYQLLYLVTQVVQSIYKS